MVKYTRLRLSYYPDASCNRTRYRQTVLIDKEILDANISLGEESEFLKSVLEPCKELRRTLLAHDQLKRLFEAGPIGPAIFLPNLQF